MRIPQCIAQKLRHPRSILARRAEVQRRSPARSSRAADPSSSAAQKPRPPRRSLARLRRRARSTTLKSSVRRAEAPPAAAEPRLPRRSPARCSPIRRSVAPPAGAPGPTASPPHRPPRSSPARCAATLPVTPAALQRYLPLCSLARLVAPRVSPATPWHTVAQSAVQQPSSLHSCPRSPRRRVALQQAVSSPVPCSLPTQQPPAHLPSPACCRFSQARQIPQGHHPGVL